MPAARLHLHLLGSFCLRQGDLPVAGFDQARLQHLLAYLVLHRTSPISRQQLAFSLWPETSDAQALKNLRTLLTRLRHALPNADQFVDITPQIIQWRPGAPLTLDVTGFESAAAQAKTAQEAGDPTAMASALAAAIAAYTGELLPDCYDDWIYPLRERLHEAFGDALERMVLLLEEQRAYGDALPYARRLVQHDPLHEPAYRHLMRLHVALGDRTEALRVYGACETMLEREFKAAPARPTRDLYERLLETEDWPALTVMNQQRGMQPASIPLVGRKDEWSRLLTAWRTAAAGRPLMVLLAGEAGIGKTRLAEELCAWVARQGAGVAVAHCYPGGGGVVAYAPIVEWLRDPTLRPRLAFLEDGWLVEVARILPELLADRPDLLPSAPLTEGWQRTRLFEALARAVLAEAHTPLLLFLDDLQWCDQETLDWLGYLLRFAVSAPLLIVGTVRKYELGRDHPLMAFWLALTRSGLLSEIPLAPLDATETGLLAANVAGRSVEAGEADRIYRDTEGNPLFVVEMVRAGFENRLDPLSAPPLSASASLPPKVRAVIQWRLSMISPAGQSLAQIAAVIGRKFSLSALVHASDQDEAAVVEALDELWRHYLVRAQGGATYDFSHDGVRAVAYDDIGPIRRPAIHLRVARAFEALHGHDLDAFSGLIAANYEQAGQVQPAIAFYRRAAAAAQRIYANVEAERLYRHLLEGNLRAGLSTADRCAAMLALGEVWRVTGQWASARTMIGEAMAEAEALGEPRLLAQAQRSLGDVMRLLGYYDAALEWLAKAEEGFRTTGDGRGVASVLWTTGQIHWLRGDPPRALAVLEQQLRIVTEEGDLRGISEALETMGMVHWSRGDWDRSADCCLQSIRIAGPLEYKPILARASITLGNIRSAQYWIGEAVYWYHYAGVLARQTDDRQALSWAISNIALLLARRGDYVRALAGYERSLRTAWAIGDRWTACLNVAGLGSVNERLGRIDLAESLYRKAIDFGFGLGVPSYLSSTLVSLARLLLDQGRPAEASDFYGEALAKIAGVAGERLTGADTRFDARVVGIRLRYAQGETTAAETITELRSVLICEDAPDRHAALNYELWRLAPEDEDARIAAAEFYRSQHVETGAEECRSRYRELTGETLPDPPPLPDVSELIPDGPVELDLARLLAELAASFE
jgi:DNA-binding SARP family transcriptional activator